MITCWQNDHINQHGQDSENHQKCKRRLHNVSPVICYLDGQLPMLSSDPSLPSGPSESRS
jgi:hypothetical protein